MSTKQCTHLYEHFAKSTRPVGYETRSKRLHSSDTVASTGYQLSKKTKYHQSFVRKAKLSSLLKRNQCKSNVRRNSFSRKLSRTVVGYYRKRKQLCLLKKYKWNGQRFFTEKPNPRIEYRTRSKATKTKRVIKPTSSIVICNPYDRKDPHYKPSSTISIPQGTFYTCHLDRNSENSTHCVKVH